jgi:hypothetical protein
MPSSVLREREALAQKVRVTADELYVELVDGRTVSAPVQWYDTLALRMAPQLNGKTGKSSGEALDPLARPRRRHRGRRSAGRSGLGRIPALFSTVAGVPPGAG